MKVLHACLIRNGFRITLVGTVYSYRYLGTCFQYVNISIKYRLVKNLKLRGSLEDIYIFFFPQDMQMFRVTQKEDWIYTYF